MMNRHELGKKLTEVFMGKKVDGTIAAVLHPRRGFSSRIAVSTEEGLVDLDLTNFDQNGFRFWQKPEALRKGQVFSRRIRQIKPWVDGQSA